MDLACYVYPGWKPRIRPSSTKRDWMDNSPESYAYRCLPLDIANSYGWELLSPCAFEVTWNGGLGVADVVVRADKGAQPHDIPVALFGQGTFTFHIQGLFRTPPGWNLWVSGSPNHFKDGAAPLSGIIETDWAPYTFTMNWKLTRPDHMVRFEENEPFAHIFPIERKVIEAVEPCFRSIGDDQELKEQFETWSSSRDAFQKKMRENPPNAPAEKWQKLYYRGLTPNGECPVGDHQSKLQVKDFANRALVPSTTCVQRPPAPAIHATPLAASRQLTNDAASQQSKSEWLLATMERQRALSATASGIFKCEGLTSDDFLDYYYAPGRPAVIVGEISDWAAFKLWTPDYLRAKLGSRMVEYQGGRGSNANFERDKNAHKQQMRFDHFIDLVTNELGNDAYITAYNSATNDKAFYPLNADVGPIEKFLVQSPDKHGGMLWIGPKGTFTSLHHDLTNNLLVQVTGRKRIVMAAAAETPKLYNDHHVFSAITDVTDPALDIETFPRVKDVRFHEIILEAGEMLFIPVGWWHQVESLDFSVSITFTNFRWRNDAYETYPRA